MMVNRSISLILIALVLACPMLCHSGDCCHQDTLHEDHCTASHCGCRVEEPGCDELSCCDPMSKTDCSEEPSPAGHCPDQAPFDSTCQCFCGGAVVGKVCEFGVTFNGSYLPAETAETSLLVLRARHGGVQFNHHRLKTAKNRGRVMRILYGSFLC